jgi:Asp-tRNA(Asn)/Glu-tRNA(Gln) amidotransferase A subunit family amidase
MTAPLTVDVETLTLTDAAGLIASGDVSPSDLFEAYGDRIRAIEPLVQAWSHIDWDGARAVAVR